MTESAVPLFGRDTELETLRRETRESLERRNGHIFFVIAPAGAGKSALVSSFLDTLAHDHPDARIARGRCLPTFGGGEPYLPFIDALRDLSNEDTAGAVKSEKLSGLLQELAPYWLSVVPLVGSLLSATLTTTLALSGRGKAREAPSREALFMQYLELLQKLAEDAPLILVLEDRHWADHASMSLLAHIARGVTRHPLVVLGTLRPAEQTGTDQDFNDLVLELERERIATRMLIGDLDDAAINLLLESEFQGDLSAPLRKWMKKTAGGHPLFLQELARLLRDSHGVRFAHGEWTLTETAASVGVPRSAEAVIEKRFQRLDAESIRLLQYASVQGNQFDSSTLAGLLEQDELQVLDALERLQRVDQVVAEVGQLDLPDGDAAVVYQFRHALMQTVLYAQIAGKRRVLLHRKAGQVVEKLFATCTEKVASELALHYHEGRVSDSAYRYARMAALQAIAVHGHWEAEQQLRIALTHTTDAHARAEVCELLADSLERLGHYTQAVEFYEQALSESDRADRIRVARKQCIAQRKAALLPAPQLLTAVRSLLAEPDIAAQERCRLLLEVTRLPNAVEAEEAAREALEVATTLATASNDPANLILHGDALLQYGVTRLFAGHTQDALDHFARALDVARANEDILMIARCHGIAGVANARLGHYLDARTRFQDMLDQYERVGEPNPIAAACTNIGILLLRLGDLHAAEEILQRAKAIHERRDRATLVQSVFMLAERARLAGDFQLGLERFAELAARAQEFEYWTSEAVAHSGLGLCALELGHLDGAHTHAERARACVADHDEWFEDRDIVELLLARLEHRNGHDDLALQRLDRASAQLAHRDVYLWARIELERAMIYTTMDVASATDIVEGVAIATADMQSPALQQAITRSRSALISA
jgi:tetratricopeptide (TPR) repeat protein